MDALFNSRMREVLAQIPVDEIKNALLGKDSRYRPIFDSRARL
jgi:hypothetical protein